MAGRHDAEGSGSPDPGSLAPGCGHAIPERPKLRALEAFPVEHEGQRMVGLRDPAAFTDQVALLPVPMLELLTLFDGEHTIAEMEAILGGGAGQGSMAEEIATLAERLDMAGFLDSPRFARRRRAIEERFAQSPVRPAVHAGGAYAGEAGALRAQLDSFFTQEGGARILEGPPDPSPPAPIRGLIAPHIDFRRGGSTYACAYRELAARSDADLFVILGTCHAGMPDPFAVTLKPYDTPLGAAPVDREFCEALQRRYRHNLLASESAHRAEHSIEFQVIVLRHLLGERRPFTILPVLASFADGAVSSRGDPERDPRVSRFVEALLEAMAASSRKVCLIAGVDLAHVGPRFGDPAPNSVDSFRALARADRGMLEYVTAGDPLGFYLSVAADGDRRRICGLSPLYAFLRALPGVKGRLLGYRQWPDPEGAVTFCAAAFP